jgi:hypothetical protein
VQTVKPGGDNKINQQGGTNTNPTPNS